ncbi:hypothetical protein [Saccharolobus islandicus]|uniref:Uncharacterized protein n=1 Tax=Saccharolobus islandicus (strain M.16.27) TaxID=427318 RepID=C3N613_SACI3|nr:hypothetical protein [Sulfolobus islandicus]ACP55438.1 hypothetical protein M1627_1554 [Sulfolobus islandicus M.16.27]
MRSWLKRIAKKYHQEGFGLKTMVAGAAAGLMFAFAASPSTIASLFGGTWPNYVPQAPFQIFSGIAGLGLGYETFHLYREYKKLRKN